MDESYKKILVSNIAHIGDAILATASLPVIKNAFPKAEIGFLVSTQSKEVVRDHIFVDHVHIFNHPHFIRSQASLVKKKKIGALSFLQALEEVKKQEYDLAIDLYSLRRQNSGCLLKRAGIPVRVGFFAESHHYFTHKCASNFEHEHVVEDFGRCLKFFGFPHVDTLLKPTLEYRSAIKNFPLPENYILLHVGAGLEEKEWREEYWKKLLFFLRSFGLPRVFIGHGAKESALISQIKEENDIDLSNQCTWKELLPIMRKARFFIGLDSMAGHMAAACNTKSVIIYGGMAKPLRWRPYNSCCHVVIPPPEYCEDGKPLRFSALQITPEVVFRKIEEVF